jgi:predicted phosphodiesterase
MKLEKILFWPDSHIPYHDKKAFNLVLKVAKDIKIQRNVILGDFADFYKVSSHSKDPSRTETHEDEVEAVIKALKEIKAIGAKRNIFIAGNHEDRLERYLMEKCPELYSSNRIDKVLKLQELGFEYVKYKENYTLGKLKITHDCGYSGRNAVFQNLASFQHSIIAGHSHRLAYIVEGNAVGEQRLAASFGWLGDTNKVDYMHKVKVLRDWALGFGLGYMDPRTGFVYVVPVPIVRYTCVVEGKLYVG